ncbi:tRNA 2-thiouridine(34) synthase MnmA [candidate division KSB1 bacterium]|nr:tRNA 2-thiouridine(34) synthase MnmA [candidate division KSB1 bacterium]
MSGGVDSSVAAYLLKEKGCDVFGITMLHMENFPGLEKTASDARDVCKQLGIPHYTINNRALFEKNVIKNFICEYEKGRTPNPCVMCNREIKWGQLRLEAIKLGAEYFSTGHYARIEHEKNTGRYILFKAVNQAKDQSYALWRLSQEQLSKTIFPLGELEKQDTRRLAAQAGLHIAEKKESQEICFIPDDDYRRFLRTHGINFQNGPIVTKDGKIVGEHQGIPFYTIGQRKGLGVALGRPVYVTKIDRKNNRIYVGDKSDLLSSGLIADQTNWIAMNEPNAGTQVEARIRYNDPGYPAVLEKITSNGVTVRFFEPRPAVTAGQSAVFYQGERVVGGGIIRKALEGITVQQGEFKHQPYF